MNTYIELWCNVVRAVVVVVGSVDGGDDVTRVDDVIAHHVIARGGFARHSVDARRRASPPVTALDDTCLLYTSPSPRDRQKSRMPSSA